jgi:RNA polymerase sigma-70 factor (ECF subfamily)
MSDLSSRKLVASYQSGDEQAATEIFDRYVRRLLALARRRIAPRLARRVDADDIVQSAYRSFFVHAREGDFVLPRAGDLWRLLAAITLNKLQRQVERHTAGRRDVGREAQDSAFAAAERATVEPTVDEAMALCEELQAVTQRCAAVEREALEMRLQGHTIEEIAKRLQRSQRTVRRWLEAIRHDLDSRLRGD